MLFCDSIHYFETVGINLQGSPVQPKYIIEDLQLLYYGHTLAEFLHSHTRIFSASLRQM